MIRLGEYIKAFKFKKLSQLRESKSPLKQAQFERPPASRQPISDLPDKPKLPHGKPFPIVNPAAVPQQVPEIPKVSRFGSIGSKIANVFKIAFRKRQIQEQQFKGNDANHLFSVIF